MSDLRNILKEEYKKKEEVAVTPQSLIEMIEQVMGSIHDTANMEVLEEEEVHRFSVDIDLPKLVPTEAWGDPESQSRQEIEKVFASITGGGDMKARIAHVNSFLDPAAAERKAPGGKTNTLLNMMMVIEALQATLNDYNESSAGFVFEAFMAALTGGKQEAGRVGGTLPIEDFITGAGEPVSLKLLSPDTTIHGSFTNLVDYLFLRGGGGVPSIKYLIAFKDTEGDNVSKLTIFAFEITRENFVDVMLGSNNEHLLGRSANALRREIKEYAKVGPTDQWRLDMLDVLRRVPGYTKNKGMFYKNVDASGAFDEEAGTPSTAAAEKKKKSYARVIQQGGQVEAYNAGKEAAQNGEARDETAFTPEAAPDVDPKVLRILRKKYEEGYARFEPAAVARAREKDTKAQERADKAKLKADKAKAKKIAKIQAQIAKLKAPMDAGQQIAAESLGYFGRFHEDEKRIMKEESLLLEGGKSKGGSQWGISRTAMTAMTGLILTEHYGEINLSSENIKEIAKIYTDKLGKDLISLLTLTKEFTENIGKYYSTEKRSEATAANTTAQQQGADIVKTLKADPREA